MGFMKTAALAFVCCACVGLARSGDAAPTAVPVARAVLAEDRRTAVYPGRVVAAATVRVTARVEGEILRLGFQNGQMVARDRELFVLDSVKYEAEVKSSQAKVAENKAKTAYAESNYRRQKSLFEQNAVDRDTLENALSDYEYNQALLDSALAELASAQEDLDHCRITAKIDGMIGTPNFTEGNYVTPSSGPLATVVQMDPVRVRFPVGNRDMLALFGGAERLIEHGAATVFLADDTEYPEQGVIEYMENEAIADTDSLLVFASFPNPGRALVPGSSVTVSVAVDMGIKIPAVPATAVMQDVKGAFVYRVPADGKAEKRYVTRGGLFGDLQLVESGLNPDDVVVVDGNHKVEDGVRVEPVFRQDK